MRLSCIMVLSIAMSACTNAPPPVRPGEGRTYVTPDGVTVYHRNKCGFGAHENAGNRYLKLYNVAFSKGGKLHDQPEIRLFSDDQFFSFLEKRYAAVDASMGESAIMTLGRLVDIAINACSNSLNSFGEQATEAMKLHDEAAGALIDWAVRMKAAKNAEELEPMIDQASLQVSVLGMRSRNLPSPNCFPDKCGRATR